MSFPFVHPSPSAEGGVLTDASCPPAVALSTEVTRSGHGLDLVAASRPAAPDGPALLAARIVTFLTPAEIEALVAEAMHCQGNREQRGKRRGNAVASPATKPSRADPGPKRIAPFGPRRWAIR